MSEVISFYSLASLITVCSLLVVSLKNPVGSLIFLVVDFFLLAGVYALLGADFIAAIQIIIYAGAVLILFMFVVMLLNLDLNSLRTRRSVYEYFGMVFLGLGFLYILFQIPAGNSLNPVDQFATPQNLIVDNTYDIAMKLFTDYVWPFELASILILLAVVASMLIAQRYKQTSSQKDERSPQI